jgi:hypothetical protein
LQNFTIEVEGEGPFKLHEEIIIVMQSEKHSKLEFDEYVIISTIFTTVVIDNNGQS